ncbi:MAG: EpsG family protein [Bacteroides eggerthii]|jgi:hypothetical protein
MSIYLLILFFLSLCSLLNPYIRKNVGIVTRLFFFEFLFLALLGGLRKNVGVDYINYEELFHRSDELYKMKESGFIWLVEVFNSLHLPFAVFCSLFAFLSVWLAFRFILKHSPYVFFSVLMYFSLGNYYFSTFNAMRQALATVIFLNLLSFIEEKKFWKYTVILLLTAYFVHATVLLLIPLYFFLRKDWNIFYKMLFLGITVVFNSFLMVIIENSPYAVYLKFEDFASAVPPTYYMIGLLSLGMFFYSWWNAVWRKKNVLLSNLNYLALLLIYLIFAYNNTPLVMVINRVLGYFTLIYVVLLPMLLVEMKKYNNRYVLITLISVAFAFLSYWALSRNGIENQMIPYTTIFS